MRPMVRLCQEDSRPGDDADTAVVACCAVTSAFDPPIRRIECDAWLAFSGRSPRLQHRHASKAALSSKQDHAVRTRLGPWTRQAFGLLVAAWIAESDVDAGDGGATRGLVAHAS